MVDWDYFLDKIAPWTLFLLWGLANLSAMGLFVWMTTLGSLALSIMGFIGFVFAVGCIFWVVFSAYRSAVNNKGEKR